MYRQIFVFGQGRSGTNAVGLWVHCQCPREYRFTPKRGSRLYFQEKSTRPFVANSPMISLKEFAKLSKRNGGHLNKDYRRILFVLRDPFNFFASQMRHYRVKVRSGAKEPPRKELFHRLTRGWKTFAREAIGLTHILPEGSIYVSYNHWFADRAYRKQIIEDLDLDFTDAGINLVSKHGGGSSFDRRKYNKKAQQMNVLDRWKAFQDDRFYRGLFDQEILEMSQDLFGDPPFVI